MPSPAFAEMVGGWDIQRVGAVCTMSAAMHDSTGIKFVKTPEYPDEVGLILSNQAWRSLTQKDKLQVTLLLNGAPQRPQEARTIIAGGTYGLALALPGRRTSQMFRQGVTISVAYQGNILIILTLNSYELQAYTAMSNCAGLPNDPFAQ